MIHNTFSLAIQSDSSPEYVSLKLIVKLPQDYQIKEILDCLTLLAEVQLTPLGQVTGRPSDRFNWHYLQLNSKLSELMDAGLYLQTLPAEIQVTEITFDSSIN